MGFNERSRSSRSLLEERRLHFRRCGLCSDSHAAASCRQQCLSDVFRTEPCPSGSLLIAITALSGQLEPGFRCPQADRLILTTQSRRECPERIRLEPQELVVDKVQLGIERFEIPPLAHNPRDMLFT